MKSRWNCAIWGCLVPIAILTGGIASGSEQPSAAASGPATQLAWDSDNKTINVKESELTAQFSFAVTNISDSEVVIDHVKTSCLCTVAKLPSQPWHLAPHADGHIDVTMDLKGKAGELRKTIDVCFVDTNAPPKVLGFLVKLPDRSMMRTKNLQMAQADRQAVFKGDCAKCHAEPAKTASGMKLYHQICGICHEARPRATMVPDLRMIKEHPTDYAFWKMMIANGKPGSLMPAFAISQGGPLTDEQIDAMARMIDKAYPYSRFSRNPPPSPNPRPKTR